MPRKLIDICPVMTVTVGGDVEGAGLNDVAIEGLTLTKFQVTWNRRGEFFREETTINLLQGVDTFDANVIQLLENILHGIEREALTRLAASEAANG